MPRRYRGRKSPDNGFCPLPLTARRTPQFRVLSLYPISLCSLRASDKNRYDLCAGAPAVLQKCVLHRLHSQLPRQAALLPDKRNCGHISAALCRQTVHCHHYGTDTRCRCNWHLLRWHDPKASLLSAHRFCRPVWPENAYSQSQAVMFRFQAFQIFSFPCLFSFSLWNDWTVRILRLCHIFFHLLRFF